MEVEGLKEGPKITANDTTDEKANNMADNGTGLSIGCGMESPQAGRIGDRGEAELYNELDSLRRGKKTRAGLRQSSRRALLLLTLK